MSAAETPPISRQILEEAAAWFVEFRVGDDNAATHQQFGQWLRRSPEHIQAYLELTGVWTDLALLSAQRAPDVERLVALARSGTNVVNLDTQRPLPVRASTRRWWLATALAAGVCGLVVSTLLVLHGERTYATETGEQRSITLADGSTVDLNAQSRIVVSFSSNERDVRLVQGQALFRVAKDKARPFVVQSASAMVRAVGTLFDVDQREHEAVVTVLEGRVIVAADDAARRAAFRGIPAAGTGAGAPSSESPAPVYVSAGEQVTVRASAAIAPVRADVIAATSWTRRELTFDNTRLRDVVNDFNRYNARPIVIEGEPLANLTLSGVYSSTDPASLIRFLRSQPGITVTETDAEIRVSEKTAP